MNKLFMILSILLSSCTSLPKGNRVMNGKIDKDKNSQLKKQESLSNVEDIDRYLKIYAHPQIIKGKILLREGVFYTPVKSRPKGWKDILTGDK